LRFKIRCFLIFKNFLKFKKKRKGTKIEHQYQEKFLDRIHYKLFAIKTFLSLYKNIRKRKATKLKVLFYDKRNEREIKKSKKLILKF